jgi:hypothetical protein
MTLQSPVIPGSITLGKVKCREMRNRVAAGLLFVVIGLACCIGGIRTLLPLLYADSDTICDGHDGLSVIWPSLILICFLIAYCNKLGREFWWNS